MIRIMTANEPALTMITVDGQLAGDDIPAVETICDQARSKGKPVQLFLRDVSVIGEDGQALLRRLVAKGVHLKASGIYTSYVVQSIQADLCRGHAVVAEGNADAQS
jgi:predicted nucleic acid-binding Zn ribbon protein